MSIYKHSQVGTLILWILGIAAAGILLNIFLNIASGSAIPVILVAIAVVLLACMLLFGTLTVEVAQDHIKLWFGPGLIRKEFRSSDILSAKAVRNRWFYGWGIRLTPHGWLFNVSGLDAVELEMHSGRKYRIGTDEPMVLQSAIQSVLH